jgi:protein gp37
VTFHEEVLTEALRWRKPRRVFVNSMSDLAHARVSDAAIARVLR